jgi:RNA polymerase sigma-70 factor (ECF subfamily)
MYTKEELLTIHFMCGQMLRIHFTSWVKPQDRNEVQQEIIEKILLKKLKHTHSKGAMGAWLYRLIKNHLTDSFRKKQRNKVHSVEDLSYFNICEDPSEANYEELHTDQWNQYNELLSREKPIDQQLVRLKHEKGMKYEEISRELGIPKDRLAMRYRRTVARLEKNYQPNRWQE